MLWNRKVLRFLCSAGAVAGLFAGSHVLSAPLTMVEVGPLEPDGAPWMTIQLVQAKDAPEAPLPSQPLASAASPFSSSGPSELLFGGLGSLGTVGGQVSTRPAAETAALPQTSTNIVAGAEAATRPTTDLGDLIGRSVSALGVNTQVRNPVTSDPHIRGYWGGQIMTYADGGFWTPIRLDLDTIVSKINAQDIQDVVIIKGPYSVRYGPGFSFLDVQTVDAPRYRDNGSAWQFHDYSSLTYKTNGTGWLGNEVVTGGNDRAGFRIGYNIAAGIDYETGQPGFFMPSSYNAQYWNVALGYDLDRERRIEFKAVHFEEHNVEFPGTITGIKFLSSDAYTLRYVREDCNGRGVVEGWYNYSKMHGNNLSPGQAAQYNFSSFTQSFDEGMFSSAGGRAFLTRGQAGAAQFTLGTDCRVLTGHSYEFDVTAADPLTNFPAVPPSTWINPGVFVDATLPLGDRLTLQAGARYDHVHTRIDDDFPPLLFAPGGVPSVSNFFSTFTDTSGFTYNVNKLSQDFDLWSAFVSADFKLNDNLQILFATGAAQRPPQLTELYSIGPFLSLVQRAESYYNGQPELRPEKLYQVDVGFKANYENFRAGGTAYYALVNDYITYVPLPLAVGTPFTGRRYTNTSRADFWGIEAYGEWDVNCWLTPFATLNFTEGTNQTRSEQVPGIGSEPLPMIFPLDSRAGFRIHERGRNPRWAVEFTARMVAAQTLVATSLLEQETPGFTLLDLRGYYRASDRLFLTAGIENFGDRFYQEHLDAVAIPGSQVGLFQPGINFYFSARFRF